MHNLNLELMIPKAALIEALRKNKQEHLAGYEKAVQGFFADLDELLLTMAINSAKKNLDEKYYINLQKPINNEANYDKYIEFFLLSTENEIKISASDYDCLVRDKWEWAVSARVQNSFYISKLK